MRKVLTKKYEDRLSEFDKLMNSIESTKQLQVLMATVKIEQQNNRSNAKRDNRKNQLKRNYSLFLSGLRVLCYFVLIEYMRVLYFH